MALGEENGGSFGTTMLMQPASISGGMPYPVYYPQGGGSNGGGNGNGWDSGW